MKCRIIILTLIAMIILHLRRKARELALLYEWPILILFVASIWILPVSNRIRAVLTAVVVAIYRINISLLFSSLDVFWKAYCGYYTTADIRNDDLLVRNDVTNMFSKNFTFQHNFDKLPDYPSLIVCNYVYDRLENMACIMIPKNLCILMGYSFVRIAKLHNVIKNFIFRYENDKTSQYETIKKQVREKMDEGFSVFAYVSKCTQHRNGYIGRVRTGMFRMAKDLDIPITPITIDYIKHNNGVIVPQYFRMHVGETFKVTTPGEAVYRTRTFFKKTFASFRQNKHVDSHVF